MGSGFHKLFPLPPYKIQTQKWHHCKPLSELQCSSISLQVAYNVQLLSSFLLCDILVIFTKRLFSLNTLPSGGCPTCYPDEQNSSGANQLPCMCLIAAVNRNQLIYFLFANLLTGLVNFLVQTLYCSAAKGLLIVACYLFMLNSLMLVLHSKGITVKFK